MKILPRLLGLLLGFATPLSAAYIDDTLHYQGRVSVQGVNFNGPGQFKFALVDAGTPFGSTATATAVTDGDAVTAVNLDSSGSGYTTPPLVTFSGPGSGATAVANMDLGIVSSITVTNGGSGYATPPVVTIAAPPAALAFSSYWSNDGTSTSGDEPQAAVEIPVVNGLYSVQLGGTAPGMTRFDSEIFAQKLHLRVWFNDGFHGFQQLTPDQPLGSAPHALRASTVEPGAIGSAQLAGGAVTAAKLAPGSAVGNLHSQSVMLSALANDPALTAAGFVRTGKMTTPPDWRTLSNVGAPSPRAYFCSVWTGTEWLIWGGSNSSQTFGDGARYNPATNQWTPISSVNAPSARSGAAAVWTGTEMIVWGGSSPVAAGGRYNPATDTWTTIPVSGTLADGIDGNAAVWTGSEMLHCGYAISAQLECARYNPATGVWTMASSTNKPSPRFSVKGVWTGSTFFVFGGTTTDGLYTPLANGGRYDPVTDTWTAATYGGAGVDEFTFTKFPDASPTVVFWGGRTTGSATSAQNEGGISSTGTSWTAVGTTNAPAARFLHTAVWTGTEMIVWGGFGATGSALATGGIYNHGAYGWQPTPTENQPPARYLHAAVWTGTEMLIFGGYDGTSAVGDLRSFLPYGKTLHVYQR